MKTIKLNSKSWHYGLSKKDKLQLFKELSINVFHTTYKNVMKRFYNQESLNDFLPYYIYIYLFGNDDVSYKKWFYSLDEIEDELKYLRKMQPLDLEKDFIERGYIFTN